MQIGDLVRHRDIGLIGMLIKQDTESPNERHLPWLVLLRRYNGRTATWFAANIEVLNEGR